MMATIATQSGSVPKVTASDSATVKLSLKTPRNLPPAMKERRPSFAATSSPRIVDASAYSFRDDTSLSHPTPKSKLTKMEPPPLPIIKLDDVPRPGSSRTSVSPDKRHRKKWTPEETKMLVDGCNTHGVGNWKTILADSSLTFDDRSAVDLKDRFRTYYPDAYKVHYPNAKTHLSSRVRATNPDGTSLFEKTRSKKRRPFTEEEDRALREGYEKHGCIWVQIVKDPVFQASNRRSTDLRDRFRNAFPEEYERAGYKPRGAAKKKARGDIQSPPSTTPGSPVVQQLELSATDIPSSPIRAVIDDAILSSNASSAGPVRRRRRAHTAQGRFLRGGTRSVPQSAAATDIESDDDDERLHFTRPCTPLVSTAYLSPEMKDDEMNLVSSFDNESLRCNFMPQSLPSQLSGVPSSSSEMSMPHSPIQTQNLQWSASSGVDTPTHPTQQVWTPGSPGSPISRLPSSQTHSPSTMIGKSAWGASDWFSPNPRLDSSASSISSASASSHSYGVQVQGDMSPPSSSVSPFSFQASLGGGPSDYGSGGGDGYDVMDRYDLFPAQHNSFYHGPAHNPHALHEYTSDIGAGDSFSDSDFNSINQNIGGMRGFTHHSNYAGDLMVGARTHQPVQAFNGMYNSLLAPGGLGLSIPLGVDDPSNICLATPLLVPLPGIDEIELAGISLDDSSGASQLQQDSDMVDATSAVIADSPPSELGQSDGSNLQEIRRRSSSASAASPEEGCLSLEDLVTLPQEDNEQHATPPGTPHQSPRLRSTPLRGIRHPSFALAQISGSSSLTQGRSISVPPCEARYNVLTRSQTTLSGTASHSDLGNSSGPFFDRQPNVFPAGAFGTVANSSTSIISPNYPSSSPGETSDSPNEIPFLDLHYSWNNNIQMPDVGQQYHHIQGQALDLAETTQSFSSAGAQLAAPIYQPHPGAWPFPSGISSSSPMAAPQQGTPVPPNRSTTPVPGSSSSSTRAFDPRQRPISMTSLMHLTSQSGAVRPYTMHSRGQSHSALTMPSSNSGAGSVNPRDLMLSTRREAVSIGKSKRASWDGIA